LGEIVETYCVDGMWRNRVSGREPLPGQFETCAAATEIGRAEARVRGVQHVIRRIDGSVAERNRYAREADEIPG